MTQHLRYTTLCSVGEQCPNIEEGREGYLNVTGYRPGTRIEETVELPREVIPSITDMRVDDLAGWVAARHRTDLLRVQTLTQYGVPSDGDDFHRYLDGAPLPASPDRDAWFRKLRDEAATGKIRRCVHIVREPLSDYLRYQFEWGYAYTAAAGQQIRILSVKADSKAAAWLFKVGDFNVIEGRDVIRLRYDDHGVPLGNVQVGADAAEAYAALAEGAWEQAQDFAAWWATHPQYHRARPAA